MPPIRIGIIGCGIAARELHWPALKQLRKDFTIPVVCNRTLSKAKSYADLIGGANAVWDYREVLARPDVDAVDIILPVELNWEVTRAAMKAGKHVIVEKPVAASRREARAMVQAASESDLTVMVAENFRYRRTFLKLREMIEAGRLGNLYAVNWDAYGWADSKTNPYAQTEWRLNHRFPGGFLMDCGVHIVAAFRLLMGELRWVHAQTRQVNPRLGEFDTIQIEFESEGGVMGRHALHFAARGVEENRLLLFGTKATAEVVHNRISIVKGKGVNPKPVDVPDSGGYREEFEDFARCIRTGTAPVSTVVEAYRDFEVIMAALESARTGKRVRPRVSMAARGQTTG